VTTDSRIHRLTQLLSGIQRFSSTHIYSTPESAYVPYSHPEVVYMLTGVVYAIYTPCCDDVIIMVYIYTCIYSLL